MAAFANQAKADAFVSIHQNTFEDTGICGIETWYDGSGTKRDNQRLAQLVHEQTLKSTGAVERELRADADFHVTSNTKMPACLIETGFLSGEKEKNGLTGLRRIYGIHIGTYQCICWQRHIWCFQSGTFSFHEVCRAGTCVKGYPL